MPPTDLALLDQAFAWTSARISAVAPADLDQPTPCSRWDLRELLTHTMATLTAFPDALGEGPAPEDLRPIGPSSWDRTIAEVAARSLAAWARPDAMDATLEMPFATLPAPIAISANLLEAVVHGWDIGQATGEGVEIPEPLAVPILAFARQAIGPDGRGDQFAADLGLGDSPAEQLVAYLGRKPR